jgi:hypothetical protein
MPTMNGWQLLQLVETTGGPLTRHAFIVLSGATTRLPDAFRDLLGRRAIPVLPKPCDPATLLATIAAVAARVPLPGPLHWPAAPDAQLSGR